METLTARGAEPVGMLRDDQELRQLERPVLLGMLLSGRRLATAW